MWRIKPVMTAMGRTMLLVMFLSATAFALEGGDLPCPPDKDLCALMIRHGNEAYDRGKYLDARKYYRLAVAADPGSTRAWSLYDRSLLSHMAQQIEKTGTFNPFITAEDADQILKPRLQGAPAAVPTPEPPTGQTPLPPPSDAGASENMPEGVIIGDDEGC